MDILITIDQDNIDKMINKITNGKNDNDILCITIFRNEYYKYTESLFPKVLCDIIISYVHDIHDINYKLLFDKHYESVVQFTSTELNINFNLTVLNIHSRVLIYHIYVLHVDQLVRSMAGSQLHDTMINKYVQYKYGINKYLQRCDVDGNADMITFIKNIKNTKEFERELVVIKEITKHMEWFKWFK